jgi:hypothetical protein
MEIEKTGLMHLKKQQLNNKYNKNYWEKQSKTTNLPQLTLKSFK